ncbi:right-handed parallel beta-helix repeat-containing protein [Dokdonella sp. MW10]|uniref:right-handed parallel beta-helix repeat-containing protein n=1 Tax=Dokdonella sp. MW10 TaxID=2992926 RepID=UPI003F7DA2E2
MTRNLLLTTLLALASTPLHAVEWFVSTTGNDSTGTGSEQTPFRTIKRVLSTSNGVARAGDTITVRGPAGNATYNECDVRLRVPLTLRSYPGERARIHCAITTPDSVTIQIDPAASGSRISNLTVSGGAYYGIMLQTGWYRGGGEHLTGASDVVIEDVLIHDTGRDGIKVTPRSDRATIRRVEIRNTGAIYPAGTPLDNRNADGIDNVNGSGMVVEDSYIHDISTTGLYFKGGSADVIVQRNRIENTGMAGILVGFDTSPEFFNLDVNPQYYESVRGIVRNNLVRNTDYAGIGLYAAKDALVANNTIENAARVGHAAIYFGITFQDWDPNARRPPSINPRVLNNLVIKSAGRCIDVRYSNELGGLSGLQGSPGTNFNGFQDAGCRFHDARPGSSISSGGTLAQWRTQNGVDANSIVGTFSVDATGHLPAGSAAINAGTTVPEVTDDIDRQGRAAPYDIGADETQSNAIFRNGFE